MTTGYSNDILNLKDNCDITISTVDRKYILKEYGMASDILIKTVDLSRHYQVGEEEVIALDKARRKNSYYRSVRFRQKYTS